MTTRQLPTLSRKQSPISLKLEEGSFHNTVQRNSNITTNTTNISQRITRMFRSNTTNYLDYMKDIELLYTSERRLRELRSKKGKRKE